MDHTTEQLTTITDTGRVDREKIQKAITMLLEAVGEDPSREGLLDTPKRVAKMYEEMFSGLHSDPKEYFKTVFNETAIS